MQSKMAAMIAEQFVQLQLKIMNKLKKFDISSGITYGERTSVSVSSNNSKK